MKSFLPKGIVLPSRTLFIRFLLLCLLSALPQHLAKACYANFSHTNACAGDTVWFYGLDSYAVHAWDFGDETLGAPNVAFNDTAYHVFSTPGLYYVTHFVNIGAEWAYETQAIEIGTDCFAAQFEVACAGGGIYTVFTNTSIGQNLTYLWDFGDPASGAENTDTIQTPYHYFTAEGTYNVSLTISNGTETETISQAVTISSTAADCIYANASYLYNICAGNTTLFYVNYSANVSMVFWDFGDPASGLANISTEMNPEHYYSEPGFYPITLVYGNGTLTDTLHWQATVLDCDVWPGDVNQDGGVDISDIFPLGIYYGETGVARPNASLSFAPQLCPNWTGGTVGFMGDMYLQQMVNKKHADCNGDGTINAEDIQAIVQNFGQRHSTHNQTYAMQMVNSTDPEMYVLLPEDDLQAGQTLSIPLMLGTPELVANNIYGFSATLQYPHEAVDAQSISVDFSNSWLGNIDSNLLVFSTVDAQAGLLHIAVVRNNYTSMTGQGLAATINLTLNNNASGILTMSIRNDAKIISNNIPFMGMGNQQIVRTVRLNEPPQTDIISSIENPDNADNAFTLQLFPNPAADLLWIKIPDNFVDHQLGELELYNAIGQKIPYLAHNTSNTAGNNNLQKISLAGLPAGIYFVQGKDTKGHTLKGRFVKQ